MLRKYLILANAILMLTACTLPFAKERHIVGALEQFENAYTDTYGDKEEAEDARELFSEVLLRIETRYVDEVDTQVITDTAIAALKDAKGKEEVPVTLALNSVLKSLDPYSAYMPPESYERYQDSLDGRFKGFGFRIELRNEELTVITPLRGSAAEEAGILPDDVISHIDGKSLKGFTLPEAVTVLRGPVGTRAVLTIKRPGTLKSFDLSVERRAINIVPVEYRIDGDVGYIKIETFNKNTGANVREALEHFEEKLGSRMCGVILDVRSNPGGTVTSAVQVADEFLEEGNIFSAINRGKSFTEEEAHSGDSINGLPIMVMINKGSASASEIVAGALKHTHRARLIGETSYGKGTMQTLYDLDNGGGIRLTTGRFTVGGGASFNGTGLAPDIQDKTHPDENELAPIARAGKAMNCTMSLRTAATDSTPRQ
ncbi:PDZ domain-containing protein [Sneathiella sp. P13V-1]|uniref:S41 family peptidase n=1 Tax=Sneathiella sp. P13V-1 TaxID=2697366 RepID=UPI00187B691C|nr:S41 family peptidase [Sneathiella sp. P13V-1]MBE7635647.1 PDZ domain-containing protein [Sneathiella sp. P13V-1]